MSRFFVGQRVRKARGNQNIGMTGIVEAVGYFPAGFTTDSGSVLSKAADIAVRYPTKWENTNGYTLPAARPAYSLAELFEPLTDPGRELVAWSECLWQPEGISA